MTLTVREWNDKLPNIVESIIKDITGRGCYIAKMEVLTRKRTIKLTLQYEGINQEAVYTFGEKLSGTRYPERPEFRESLAA